MAKIKYDAVVQAVHYKPDGNINWVRSFQRRGPIFTDYVILDREHLIDDIKSGKRYMTGTRTEYLAGTFEVDKPVRIFQTNGNEFLVTNESRKERDYLEGVPVI